MPVGGGAPASSAPVLIRACTSGRTPAGGRRRRRPGLACRHGGRAGVVAGRGPAALDAAVVVLLFASMAVSMATKPLLPGQRAPTWWAYLLCAGLCLPFAFHRRRPVVALAARASSCSPRPRSLAGLPRPAGLRVGRGVALHCDRRRALLAAAASAGALVVAVRLQPAGVQDSSTIVATLLAVAVAWLAGENLRSAAPGWPRLEERARLARGRARGARAPGRRRGAAADRPGAARRRRPLDERHRGAGRASAHHVHRHPAGGGRGRRWRPSRRRAAPRSTEMRRLLGVLRGRRRRRPASAPPPGLADLAGLVEPRWRRPAVRA